MNQVKWLLLGLLLGVNAALLGQRLTTELVDKDHFDRLSGRPLTGKYGQVSALKIVFSLENKQLYFIDANRYKYHHEFCAARLGGSDDFKLFNELNYSNSNRRKFLLGNINYYSSLDTYALELSPADLMDVRYMEQLYHQVLEHSFLQKDVHFLVNTARLKGMENELEEYFPLLDPAQIYGSLSYQAISKYKNQGRLRLITDLKKEIDLIKPSDIIVINETPLILPKVAGIIATEFQTPLSHLSILGQNRKIPIMAYKHAFTSSEFKELNSEYVSLRVENDTFYMDKLSKLKAVKERRKKIKLRYDLSVHSLTDIKDAGKRSHSFAGNKAGNFAILERLSQKHDFKVPENAFVIPFSFYDTHIKNTGLDSLMSIVVSRTISKDTLKVLLKRMRKKITEQKLDTVLLSHVLLKMKRDTLYTRYRFRSSTNAEDAKGFSGAGLYTSKTGKTEEPESVEKAIKKVWASLWSYKAYQERSYFNIDHSRTYMAILVHRSFPQEHVNGVAITKNIYRKSYPGFVVNAQLGDESVVDPAPGVVCDQFICYPSLYDNVYTTAGTIDIISVSNLTTNEMVMTRSEVQHLADQLEHIKRALIRVERDTELYFDQGLDIEFKLDGPNRELYIKQVRFFND